MVTFCVLNKPLFFFVILSLCTLKGINASVPFINPPFLMGNS